MALSRRIYAISNYTKIKEIVYKFSKRSLFNIKLMFVYFLTKYLNIGFSKLSAVILTIYVPFDKLYTGI